MLKSIYYITWEICLKFDNRVYLLIQLSIRGHSYSHFDKTWRHYIYDVKLWYDIIDIMTFCNCNVIVTRLICIFITRVQYDIYCMTVLRGQWPMIYDKICYVCVCERNILWMSFLHVTSTNNIVARVFDPWLGGTGFDSRRVKPKISNW